ncbi:MAG: efflux RND transporter permease subunit, partial [Pseudomonadota bacterium]
MIAWFARNHVAANLLMVAIIATGLWSLMAKTPLEVFPSVELDSINIHTTFPGATPEEVEESVTVPIEQAIQDVVGIEEVRSRSRESKSRVTINIESGQDTRRVLDEIRARVDAITIFPVDVERPVIAQYTSRREVISVVVSGLIKEAELRALGHRVRDELLALPEITQVDLESVRDPEISIEVGEQTLRQFGLDMDGIAAAISAGSLNVSAGNLRTEGGELLLRTRGQAYTAEDFEHIVIRSDDAGARLKLGDIATIRDGFDEVPEITTFNGEPAVILEVFRVGQQSAIEVAAAARDYVDTAVWLPESVSMKYWRDRSLIVKARLKTLLTNALQGGALVVLLLTLFLRPAVAFWVSIGIPVAFLGSFMVLPLLGVSMNLVSLFAFIVVLGLVVDDAIVTGENVYTHLRAGEDPLQAAVQGTREVAIPVTFGILTTVAAFVPLTMVGGYRGAVWAQIPAVVIPVLLFSLVESKLVLPAHLKYVKPRDPNAPPGMLGRFQQSVADGLEKFVARVYQPVLGVCIRYRYATV